MQIIFFALFLALAGVAVWLLHRVVLALRYPLDQRYLGCRSVAGVLLLMVLGVNVYTLGHILTGIDRVINSPSLSSFWNTVLPRRGYRLLYMLLTSLALNVLMLAAVIAVLALIRLIFRRADSFISTADRDVGQRLVHLPWTVVGRYYDEEGDSYLLNDRGHALGMWAGGIKYAFLIIWIVQLGLTAVAAIWFSEDFNDAFYSVVKAWNQIPLAMFLLCEQVQFMLEGEQTDQKAMLAGSFGSEDMQERWSGRNIDTLLSLYRETFRGSRFLLRGESIPYSEEGVINGNDLGNQQKEDCLRPDVLEALGNQLRECGVTLSHNYGNALVRLLNGESLNVRDHSQGEFLIYLVTYLNFFFSQGRTALVLCKDEDSANQFAHAMRTQLTRLNSLYNVWNVCTLEESNSGKGVSVLVCSCQGFLDYNVVEKRQDLTETMFFTVFADGDEIFGQNNVQIQRLFNELARVPSLEQYLVFAQEDNDDLRTTVEQYIGREIAPVNNDFRQKNTSVMVWREEGLYKPQMYLGIGSPQSPYLGTALPLALVGVKYDLPRVYIVPDDRRGDNTYFDVLAMSEQEAQRYIGRSVNLDSAIRRSQEEAVAPRDVAMLVVYDSNFNFFNALRRWMKYGGEKGTMLHVISPAYLLRDYFAANFRQLLLRKDGFDAIFPHSLGMRTSQMAVLLVGLCSEGMTERALMEKNREMGWGYDSVISLLEDCLRVTLRDAELHSVFEYFQFARCTNFRPELGAFESDIVIRLTDENIRSRLMDQIGMCQMVVRNDQRIALPILKGNLTNYCLRDQIVAAQGYLYRVTALRDGCLYAVEQMPQTIQQYYQISSFAFDRWDVLDNCSDTEEMDLDMGTVASRRRIYGYWASVQGNDFYNESGITLKDLREDEVTSETEEAYLLRIRIKRPPAGQAAQLECLLAMMLGELFKTLFPMSYQNIFAVTAHNPGENFADSFLEDSRDFEDRVRSIIPWSDTLLDGKDEDGYAVVYVVEHSCMEYGMVQTLYQNQDDLFSLISEYLGWYLSTVTTVTAVPNDVNSKTIDESAAGAPMPREGEGSFLHFGAPNIPRLFAPEALLEVCSRIAPAYELPPDVDHDSVTAQAECCTFCGRPTLFPVIFSDDRCMCAACKEHQAQQEDEIMTIYQATRTFMEDGFHIEEELPQDIHVRFASAKTIRRAMGETDGRVLGFYNSGNHQLWLEARGPRVAMRSTVLHELTHAWQFRNLNMKALLRKLPGDKKRKAFLRLCLIEGHAVYVEVEGMRRMNEDAFAERLHERTMLRQDEYGIGYRLVQDYLKEKANEGSHMTPFEGMRALFQDIIDGKVTIGSPEGGTT